MYIWIKSAFAYLINGRKTIRVSEAPVAIHKQQVGNDWLLGEPKEFS